jgi:hypothetical protein
MNTREILHGLGILITLIGFYYLNNNINTRKNSSEKLFFMGLLLIILGVLVVDLC